MSGVEPATELKVCVRCRPFSKTDRLGVLLDQREENSGEAILVNLEFERETASERYAFGYTWWGAHNYKRYLQNDQKHVNMCRELKSVSQVDVYNTVGEKMFTELLRGQAVVMFAYGLSGAGKTYTVFGPDDPHCPQAWYKHPTPHEDWGLFPRIAYKFLELATMRDGWKVRIKYYQNVVDTVIDLLDPESHAQSYHSGMHRDSHGFMDMSWCKSIEIDSWKELLVVLTHANGRKSIAPTQFNPSSTRGHCILFYEIDMPNLKYQGVTTTARMYVCDLAGVEPAADVYWAHYDRLPTTDGGSEYIFRGKDPNKKKTHELVEQGKAINLSLSEMSLFFRKMASAMKRHNNTLKPGETVVGCNNYFLGKFLKQTMLQAHTYLFAAVRPELSFQAYTRSTLDFAKNASVVKLLPKKMNRGEIIADEEMDKTMEKEEKVRSEMLRLQNTMTGTLEPTERQRKWAEAIVKDSHALSETEKASTIEILRRVGTRALLHSIVLGALHLQLKDDFHIHHANAHGGNYLDAYFPLLYRSYIDAFNEHNKYKMAVGQEIRQLQADLQKSNLDLSKQSQCVQSLQEGNARYKKHVEDTISALKTCGEEDHAKLTTELQTLQAKITLSEETADKMHEEIERLHQHEVSVVASQSETFATEQRKLKLQLECLLKDNRDLAKSNKLQGEALEASHEHLDLAQEEVRILQARVLHGNEESKKNEEQYREIKSTLHDKLTELKDLNEEKLVQLSELQAQLLMLKKEKKLAKVEESRLQGTIRQLESNAEKTEEHNQTLKGSLSDSEIQINHLQQELKEKADALSSLKKAHAIDIEHREARARRLEDSLVQLKRSFGNEVSEVRGVNASLEMKLSSLKSKYDNSIKNFEELVEKRTEEATKATATSKNIEQGLLETIRERNDSLAKTKIELEEVGNNFARVKLLLAEEQKLSSALKKQVDNETEAKEHLLASYQAGEQLIAVLHKKIGTQKQMFDTSEENVRNLMTSSKLSMEASQKSTLALRAQLKSDRDALETKSKRIQSDLQDMHLELSRCKDELSKTKAEANKLPEFRREIVILNESILSKQNTILVLRENEKSLLKDHKVVEDAFHSKCAEMKSKRKEAASEMLQLRNAHSEAMEEFKAEASKESRVWKEKAEKVQIANEENVERLIEAEANVSNLRNENAALKKSIGTLSEVATLESRKEVEDEVAALKMAHKSSHRKYMLLQQAYKDIEMERQLDEESHALAVSKLKHAFEKQLSLMKVSLSDAEEERKIAVERFKEIKNKMTKNITNSEALSDAVNRRDVKIISIEKSSADDRRYAQEMREMRDLTLQRNNELEKTLASLQEKLRERLMVCADLEEANSHYREQDQERHRLLSQCQRMMGQIFNIGVAEAHLVRLARSPRPKKFRGRHKQSMASSPVPESARRHMQNVLVTKTVENRDRPSPVLTPTRSTIYENHSTGKTRMMRSRQNYNSVLGIDDLSAKFDDAAPGDKNSGPSRKVAIYTGEVLDENIQALASSFNILARQLSLHGN